MAEVVEAEKKVVTNKDIDYGKALSWFIKDTKFWPTVLTLSLYLLSCILILPMFYVVPLLTGYLIDVIRNIQQGKFEVPEVGGDQWKDGAVLVLISMAVGFAIGFVAFVIVMGISILSTILEDSSSATSVILNLFASLISYATQAITSLFVPFFTYLAYAIYAKTGSINSIFQVSNYQTMWKRNGTALIIGTLIATVAISALAGVGFFACCIGVLPATVIGYYILAGFIGQFDVEEVE